MDSLIKQTRRKHPASQEKTGEVSSSTREKKVPARKSVSFKEDKKKPQNWLQKQFSRQMSGQSYDPIRDMDHAAAVAATAYAIATFEETWLESYHSGLELGPSLTRSKSRKNGLPFEEPRRFSEQLSFLEPEAQDHRLPTVKPSVRKSPSVKKTPTFAMHLREDHTKHSEDSVPEPMRIQPPQSSVHTSRKGDSTADAWEKAELAKINARYEKLNRKIDLWEAKKRDKARRKLDKSEQSEMEQRRRRGLQRFREDTEYIEHISAGARAQADKQRHSEELKAKEKARIIRSTGKLPGKACLCF
ncbi:unnamed protein product [Arabis nemorensis]|uniref:Remorin C-terminal domain-containing protein n=1 Tax=Arabis nemorensis TaxID=586526 RepID=A0A565AQC6_9BRAS|nr:unnamed protein product [Arabis nemorensis]